MCESGRRTTEDVVLDAQLRRLVVAKVRSVKEESAPTTRICQEHPAVGRHHHILRLNVAVRQVHVVQLLQSLHSQAALGITSRH